MGQARQTGSAGTDAGARNLFGWEFSTCTVRSALINICFGAAPFLCLTLPGLDVPQEMSPCIAARKCANQIIKDHHAVT